MSQETSKLAPGVNYDLSGGSGSPRRRTLDEGLFVRFPALYRRLAERTMRLSPGSPLRRRLLIRLVRHSYAAANRRDFELLLTGLDPEIEFRPRGGLIAADVDAVSRGREGYVTVWQRTLDAFEDLRIEPEKCLDLGDKLLITVKFEAHGSGSGVPVSQRVFQFVELRRGLVSRVEDFANRDEALEAAGLLG